ncbi:MAG: DUF952 domain-containing protein [Litorimonas sp.]
MQSDPTHIYKILTPDQWDIFSRDGETLGSPLDQADGFLHFSTPAQLAETLAKHFAKAGPLVLAEIPMSALAGQDVRWEPAREGRLFPHLYGILYRNSLSQHWPLHADARGVYGLPETIGT